MNRKSFAAKVKPKSDSLDEIDAIRYSKLSHITQEPHVRLHDALSSFVFFLINELPDELSQVRLRIAAVNILVIDLEMVC
jgi:hypothetical protein